MYYPQKFFEECKYIDKEKKVSRYINDALKFPLMILINNRLKNKYHYFWTYKL